MSLVVSAAAGLGAAAAAGAGAEAAAAVCCCLSTVCFCCCTIGEPLLLAASVGATIPFRKAGQRSSTFVASLALGIEEEEEEGKGLNGSHVSLERECPFEKGK